jgi:hypothetical protein
MLIPAILTLSGGPSRAAGPRAQEVLAAADAVRNPAEPFQVSIALLDYRARKENQASRIQVYARMEPGRGQYDTLVRFLEPSRERHKLLLKTGNEIWFFDRSTRAGVAFPPISASLAKSPTGTW